MEVEILGISTGHTAMAPNAASCNMCTLSQSPHRPLLQNAGSVQQTQEGETWVGLHGDVDPPSGPIKQDPKPVAPKLTSKLTSKSTTRNLSGTKHSRVAGRTIEKWQGHTVLHKPNFKQTVEPTVPTKQMRMCRLLGSYHRVED